MSSADSPDDIPLDHYGVASASGLLKIIGLFCNTAL